MTHVRMRRITRREALTFIGAGAAAAAAPWGASAQSVTFPPGAIIRTLFRDYPPGELAGGATLFHEHLSLAPDFNARFFAATAAVRGGRARPGGPPAAGGRAGAAGPRAGGAPPAPDPMRDVALMTEELRAARQEGVACLVDAGTPDMGRDLAFIREAAKAAGLPVVVSAGFYAQPFYGPGMSTMAEEQIVEALVAQADEGPAGVLGEIGSWDVMTADERKVFRAVGKAHVATGLPVLTHTGIPGKEALEQLDILEAAGVTPSRIVIGHLGNLVDANVTVQKAICTRGAFVGFDRQGGNGDAQQVPLVLALLEAGFADNLLFAADTSRGYGKTLTVFLPKLRAAGVPDAVLQRIMVDNSRRFLAFVPKRPRRA